MSMKSAAPRERNLQPTETESYEVRAELLQRMIAARASVVIAYAPSLYGKTVLARQYAETTAGVERTAWIDASQPLFMRHLVEGTLVEYCHSLCNEPHLAVFDGLPRLGERMMRSFLEALEVLYLECDVMVTSRYDEFADACTLETCIIRGSDLLLGIDELRQTNAARAGEFPLLPAWRKVPGLYFGAPGERIIFEEKLVDSARRGEMESAEALALVFGSGDVRTLQRFFRDDIRDVIAPLEMDAPHCGFNSEADTFSAFPVSDAHKVDVLKGVMPALLDSSSFDSYEELQGELVATLVECEREEFALSLALSSHDRAQIEGFLERYGQSYLLKAKAQELISLVEDGLGARDLDYSQLSLYAEALMLANRRSDALTAWRKMAALASSPIDACFAYLRILVNTDHDFEAARSEFLERVRSCGFEGDALEEGLLTDMADWREALVFWAQQILSKGKMLASEFAAFVQRPSDTLGKMALIAGYLEVVRVCHRREAIQLQKKVKMFKQALFRVFCQEVDDLPPNRYESSIKMDVDALFGGVQAFELPSDFVKRAEVMAGKIPLHASAYRMLEYEERQAVELLEQSSEDPGELDEGMVQMRFFGRFEVRTRDELLIGATNQSRNIKRLLGMLAARHGSVVSREWVGRVLWPSADRKQARKSFYNLCTAVKEMLRADDQENSVLVMDVDSVWLDSAHVISDLDEVDRLLAQMNRCDYSAPEAARMLALFERYKGVYLEGVEDEETKAIRQGYESRKAEALMVAGEYLYGKGELRLAKRYVSEVFDIARVREDACYLMMCILRDLGQYSQAIRTYLDCRRELVEEVGIDGPARLERLYRELIGQ